MTLTEKSIKEFEQLADKNKKEIENLMNTIINENIESLRELVNHD